MPVEFREITESNQCGCEHVLTDLHEAVRLLTKIDRELEPLRPLLAQFTSPAAAVGALRRGRKAGRG
jgi:hypothetical protein